MNWAPRERARARRGFLCECMAGDRASRGSPPPDRIDARRRLRARPLHATTAAEAIVELCAALHGPQVSASSQCFLESGFDTFKEMQGAKDFLGIIRSRERALAEAMFEYRTSAGDGESTTARSAAQCALRLLPPDVPGPLENRTRP